MQIDSILLFEQKNTDNLYPFNILHCSWEVRCGAFRLFEKIKIHFPNARIIFHSGRKEILDSFLARFEVNSQEIKKENIFVLNSFVLPDKELWEKFEKTYEDFIKSGTEENILTFTSSNRILGMYIPASHFINPTEYDKEFLPRMLGVLPGAAPRAEIDGVKFIDYLWDAIEYNAEAIEKDFEYFSKCENHIKDYDGVYFINKEKIFLGKDVRIAPGVVLDAAEGSIIIDNDVKIMANSVIIGPCYIGKNSIVKVGAKIYEKNSIGEWCKVGGEIENSIIQSYSNKQHEGFLGHSYISEWVNLGADTNTSDLKNTYGNISVYLKDRDINTERMFLGILCGDHTKSAINTAFTTGSVIGICANIVGEGYMPKVIQSFAWGGKEPESYTSPEKVIEIAQRAMARRNKVLTPEEEKLIVSEYEMIKTE